MQENKIKVIQKALKNISQHLRQIVQVKEEMQALETAIREISIPVQPMPELSKQIKEMRIQLGQPVITMTEHHHHFPKFLWITIAFSVGLIGTSVAWHNIENALEQ